jgi:hypothetical protein
MAFSDPQSIKIDGVTISLPRTSTDRSSSTYTSSDGNVDLTASSTTTGGGRHRRVIRVDHSKISSDPYIPANNARVSSSVYLVIDEPDVGYTNEELKKIVAGFIEAITASSSKLIDQLLGGES